MTQEKAVNNPSSILGEGTIQDFRASLRGTLLQRGDDGYDTARHLWNGMIDKYPALIVRCGGAADIITSVRFARSQNLVLAVKGGGHSFAGNSACEGGLMLDLSGMKGIRVDPLARTARAEPGVTWGEFDRETAFFGLATTGGLVSTTGIAGLTVGGGIGWLMRKYGLTCDNLLSVDIVTADGRLLTASATQNEDLFWAVRGGGGNFGIVTSFEYRLHTVNIVLGGPLFYPVSQAKEVLQAFRELTATAPDELTAMAGFLVAPPAPFLPAEMHGTILLAIICAYCGPIEEGEAIIRPLRTACPPAVDLVGPIPYTALQSMFDLGSPRGMQYYLKSHYLQALNDESIDTIVAHASQLASPLSVVHIHHIEGAVSRIDEGDTAFANRATPYILNIVPGWADQEESNKHIGWARQFWSAMQPFATGGVYVNFMGNDESTQRVKGAYGANYDRLLSLKQQYDPSNFFKLNQNIKIV